MKSGSGAKASELLQDRALLEVACEQLMGALPSGVSAGYLTRHLSFMKHYLDLGDQNSSRGDINDICEIDLPSSEPSFENRCHSH